VALNRAVADRGRAARRGTRTAAAVIRQATAEADAYEVTARIVGPADGAIVANRQVEGSQDDRGLRDVPCRILDRAATAGAHRAEVAPARVAAAPTGLVVLEGTVRDRGHPTIEQATAHSVADATDAAGACIRIVGTPEGQVVSEGASG